ncbi:uncharacterized protein LOC125652384 isoform X1 [Ostrea edulis]|uniref:uncharacterized protein LOC125652384 isoform X1 n=2 Tax=Ostrea edulis TaxID=37623 RepID=UPI0024AEC6E4|nr:uncharacterized protein LOC125652384 isoform X1 [Ostrea edulis]
MMEFDGSSNSFDYFLDNLMESDILVDDVTLGVKGEREYTELSPSHSSDSGYSAMNSPCHSVSSMDDGPISLPETLGEGMPLFPDALDEEISEYLSGKSPCENSNDSVDVVAIAAHALTTPICDFVSSDQENSSDGVITLSAISPSEVTQRETRSARIAKSKTGLENDHKTVKMPNNKENLAQESNSSKLPPIKVIKVIKTPAYSTPEDTQDQIYEAMEERNRKNAIQAKLNREKKKTYIKNLESDVEQLKSENKTLKDNCNKLQLSHKVMEEELDYLRSVLANQSVLSNLLKNIPNVKNVKLSSSFSRKRQSIDNDHDYPAAKSKRSKLSSAGVCLHVHQDKVSLEFCSKCSSTAALNGDDV